MQQVQLGLGMQLAKAVRSTRLTGLHLRSLPRTDCLFNRSHSPLTDTIFGDCPSDSQHSKSFSAAVCQSPVPDTERTGKSHYVDRIRLEIQAGNGGSGCVAFWKSAAKGENELTPVASSCQSDMSHLWCLHAGKFQPPDGGNGGHGGSVVVQASAA